MRKRKASCEQLVRILNYLDEDKEIVYAKIMGLKGKTKHTDSWRTVTEKLNANSDFNFGVIKTPRKWRQAWRNWIYNKKNAFTLTSGSDIKSQLSEAESKTKISKLINTHPSELSSPSNSETFATEHDSNNWQSDLYVSNVRDDLKKGLTDVVKDDVSDSEISTASESLWKEYQLNNLLLNLEEERLKIEKQNLLEKKRYNNMIIEIEKDRLQIDVHRNILLEKLLVAIESIEQTKEVSHL